MERAHPSLRVQAGRAGALRADLLVVPVEGDRVRDRLRRFGLAGSAVTRRARTADFHGRPDDVFVHGGDRQTVMLVGMGTEPGVDAWRKLGARARREAERQGLRRVAAWLDGAVEQADVLAAVAEGFLLGGYRFDRYKLETKPSKVESLALAGDTTSKAATWKPVLDGAVAVADLVCAARDLVNEPPSIATPTFIAKHAERLAVETPGLKVEVWAGRRLEREGLAGLLAVARGSHEEPRFIQLRYAPGGAKMRVALVGKGITFDSGGLSIKPAKSMETMKYDMAGAATVLSAVAAVAKLGLPIAVTAYAPTTENLPGERAQKPGDIIKFMNGKTAEVLNTDAEGRLVLADALALAAKTKPDVIVDVATLTGAARVALGPSYGAVLGNDQPTIDALIAAGRIVGEPLWQLPLAREYKEDIRSSIADVKNVGGPEGGTITAALFLEEFVGDAKWAHLDIAGPAFAERETPLGPRGGTAFGVRLLVEWLRQLASADPRYISGRDRT
jgi:leucyl aminopeptidase